MTTIIGLAVLFLLLAIGAPVAFAMLVSGALGLVMVSGPKTLLGVLQTTPFSAISSYELITIPMFILMAELVLVSGIADALFQAAAAWVGRVRGGLGMATALAGAGFGAICGSSTASAATLSSTSLPAMIKQGYEPKMAAGVVAISGTLAMLIPPSIALIIYGILTEINIGKLLIGGVIPGIVITLVIMGTVWFLAWQDPARAPISDSVLLSERLRLLGRVWPMLVLFLVVTGFIYTGVCTPTEASAVGALGALVLALRSPRPSKYQTLYQAFLRATRTSCMLVLILLAAHVFGYFFTLTQVTQASVAWVGSLDLPGWVIITIVLFGYLVLGCFMDQIAILVLTVPIIVPTITSLGYDPLWFGVIVIVTAEVGMVTPPVGLNCFVVSRYARRPVGEVFLGVMPHVITHLIAIALMIIFPQIILWLPSRMG